MCIRDRTSIAFGGNQADYKQKVSAIEGVGGVKVVPAFYGAGTVQLILKDSDMGVPSAELVAEVQAVSYTHLRRGPRC